MATGFNLHGIDLTKHNYSVEELSKMPTMEQLIVANRIQNQQMLQMLGLNADNQSRRAAPKQQNTKENKSKKKTKKDVDWISDMAAEEDSDNTEMFVEKKSSVATRKSKKSFTSPTKSGTSTNNSVNPSLSAALPATVASITLTTSAKRRIRKKAAQTASETDKPASPSNIYINPSSYQNKSAQQKNTSATVSGKTTEAASPSPACVQPFTGFTAEQIEAARQRSIEAQNRKEAIVRVMRAKLLNKVDLAIIEPVDCDKCRKDYEGHRICPLHYDATGQLDKAELDNRSQGYNAMKSLPEGMLVKESPIPGAGRGVFTGQFTTLRKDMIYGPYEGVRIYNESEAHQSGYCWQIYCKRKISHWIDARQVRRSNWLRYINCAANVDQQNVCAYQVDQNIYYRTVVDIGSDTELLVWYGDDYTRELGLLSVTFMASINNITINGVNLACCDCQLEFRCRQLLNQHKFTTHDSVDSDIVDVVSKTRRVTNTGGTRHVSGSVAKSDALIDKPRIAGSARSATSGAVFSLGSTGSDAQNYNLHERSVGTNGGFGVAGACTTDSVVGRCQVTPGSGGAGVSLSRVQPGVDSSPVVVIDDDRRFQCSTCCKLFNMRASLVQHTRTHTGEKPFKCTTCGAWFSQSGILTRHIILHTGEKPFGCTTCGQRFIQRSHLTAHNRIHTGVKPFECTTCGQRFTDSGSRTRHCRTHTGEKPFGCTTCGQRFTQSSHLTAHSRIHTGVKPFQCTTCGQRFTDSGSRTRHSRIHTGEKSFECTTCGQRFTDSGSLTRHSRIHTGEKPFGCTTCDERFTQSSHLTAHCRIHTGEKPFECTTCGQRYTVSSNLTKHSRLHWKKSVHV